MSKKRPRANPPSWSREVASKVDLEYWRQRLFKNSYSFGGRLCRVQAWCVKIQLGLRRKTFALQSPFETEAAQEALEIYQSLLTYGWDYVRDHQKARRGHGQTEKRNAPELDAAYWKPRLIQRKYTECLQPRGKFALSARIQHEGFSFYFPLGPEPDDAAARALRIFQTVLSEGWEAANQRFPREITVAVFWSNNPLAYTYTTMFTVIEGSDGLAPPAPSKSSPAISVCLVEPDAGVRRAMQEWIDRHARCACAAGLASMEEAAERLPKLKPDLILVSRNLEVGQRPPGLVDALSRSTPKRPVFSYGVYEDSDQVYYSFSGVSAGYLNRRRPPAELLEPVASVQRPFNLSQAQQAIRHYFQSFFSFSSDPNEAPQMKLLTVREHQILDCVSKGFLDKEIAGRLGISPWTVHGHLRNIYDKLGVHTRTEAVVKYLQK